MTPITQTVTVDLPEPIYRRLRAAADMTHRSIQEILITTVNVALPVSPDMPTDMADELAAMTLYNDDALRNAANSSLPASDQERLASLNRVADSRELTPVEEAELAELVNLYDLAVLRRAKAMAVLAHRGYAVQNEVKLAGLDKDW